MIEVDTNILVRYITKDDPQQTQVATDFLGANQCMILHTVLLETVWVLGSKQGYGWGRSEIIERIRLALGLPNVAVQRPGTVHQALGLV